MLTPPVEMSRRIDDNSLIFLELQDLGKPSQLAENTPHLSLSLGPSQNGTRPCRTQLSPCDFCLPGGCWLGLRSEGAK